MAARQRKVTLPLSELPFQAKEPHLPEATGFEVPVICPHHFSLFEMHAMWGHFIDSGSLSHYL